MNPTTGLDLPTLTLMLDSLHDFRLSIRPYRNRR